jgi:Tfp pilus assembly protein, pilus retraction ATPase PilT
MYEEGIEREKRVDVNASNPFAGNHDGGKFDLGSVLGPEEFDEMLLWASKNKAADIRLIPDAPIWCDIGGKNVPITERIISPSEIESIVRYIYGENGVGEVISGNDLDPAHEIRIPGLGVKRFRVNITGGRMIGGQGINLVIRDLPSQPIDYRLLNLEPGLLAAMRPQQGLIIVTGPTGSGKSTLLSSVIRKRVEEPDANETVIEYSKPIEYVFDGIVMPSSSVFQSHAGKDIRPRGDHHSEGDIWAYCVRNALRRKPTIIVIGEARDKATIEAVTEASLTGHLVFTTMHTIGVGETLRRMVMPFPDESRRSIAIDIMESLRVICTQLLLDKRGGGKVGCREYMVFTRDVREELLRNEIDDWPRISRLILAEKRATGQTMADAALKLLEEDLISEETYEMVAAPGKRV